MTIDSILTEWSYRLPKGYPTKSKDYELLYHVILEMTDLTPLEARIVVNKAQGIITEQIEFSQLNLSDDLTKQIQNIYDDLSDEEKQEFDKNFRRVNTCESDITEEEIKTLITEGAEAGTIEEAEQEIIERVFHLSDRSITSLMTHRSDIIWFNENENEDLIKEKILKEPHSAYPICKNSIDNIIGVVSIKDLYINPDHIQIGRAHV